MLASFDQTLNSCWMAFHKIRETHKYAEIANTRIAKILLNLCWYWDTMKRARFMKHVYRNTNKSTKARRKLRGNHKGKPKPFRALHFHDITTCQKLEVKWIEETKNGENKVIELLHEERVLKAAAIMKKTIDIPAIQTPFNRANLISYNQVHHAR